MRFLPITVGEGIKGVVKFLVGGATYIPLPQYAFMVRSLALYS